MRPETLLGDEDTQALLGGYGPIPPELARELTANSKVWLRRLGALPQCATLGDSPTPTMTRSPAGTRHGADHTPWDTGPQPPWPTPGPVDANHRSSTGSAS